MTASRRHIYLPYLCVSAAAFTAAFLIYPHDSGIFRALQAFSNRAGKFHVMREFLELFRPFGQGDVILLIAAGLGLCGARRRALHIIIALAVVAVLIMPFKIGVGRERPAFKNFQSFPSGDVATAAAFMTPLACLSPWMLPAAALVTGGVASERVYYGRHYASDALAGGGFGVLSGAIALAILRRWNWCPKRRWFALAGLLVAASPWVTYVRLHHVPYLIDVLRNWGPFGALLILAFYLSVLARRQNREDRSSERRKSSPGIGFRLILSVITASGIALIVAPWFMPIFGVRIPLMAIGLIVLLTTRTVWTLHGRNRPEAVTAIAIAGVTCTILTIGGSLLPAIRAYQTSTLIF